MKENKVKIMIFISLMLLFLGIAFVIIIVSNKTDDPNEIHEPITENYSFSEIYDINEYQTIYNCMSNYFTKLNENQNTILNLLLEDYKTKYHITSNNINNYIEKKYNYFGYEIKEIRKYYNPYFAIYYVKGEYRLEELDDVLEKMVVQDLVLVDIIHNTYSILPVLNEQKSFETLIQEYQLENYNKEINKNGINEVQDGNMTPFNEATMYFNELIDNLVNNCNQVYNIIGNETKNRYSNLNDFKKVCDSYKSENVSPAIANYKITYEEGKKNIKITDNYSIQYNFLIHSVKNYTVNIMK